MHVDERCLGVNIGFFPTACMNADKRNVLLSPQLMSTYFQFWFGIPLCPDRDGRLFVLCWETERGKLCTNSSHYSLVSFPWFQACLDYFWRISDFFFENCSTRDFCLAPSKVSYLLCALLMPHYQTSHRKSCLLSEPSICGGHCSNFLAHVGPISSLRSGI